jgi:hypothetical protein
VRWLQRATVGITFAVVGIAGASLTTQAQPPKAGCRAVSKLEYSIAKKENVIISQGGRYVRTGPFWALLEVPRLVTGVGKWRNG